MMYFFDIIMIASVFVFKLRPFLLSTTTLLIIFQDSLDLLIQDVYAAKSCSGHFWGIDFAFLSTYNRSGIAWN